LLVRKGSEYLSYENGNDGDALFRDRAAGTRGQCGLWPAGIRLMTPPLSQQLLVAVNNLRGMSGALVSAVLGRCKDAGAAGMS
jgi:hypothetical protein